jgi:hypothetical protein
MGFLSSLRHLDLSQNRFYMLVSAWLPHRWDPAVLPCGDVPHRAVYDTFIVASTFAGERVRPPSPSYSATRS